MLWIRGNPLPVALSMVSLPQKTPKHPTPDSLNFAALSVTSHPAVEGNSLASCIPDGIYDPKDFLCCLSLLSPFPPPSKHTRLLQGSPSTFLSVFLFLPWSLRSVLGDSNDAAPGHSAGHTFGECQWLGKGGWGNPASLHPCSWGFHRTHPGVAKAALGS